MSSVSNERRSEEIMRRNRDEYLQKEAELVKRHKAEVKKMTESHDKEVSEIKENNSAQMDDLRSRTRESLTEKDKENQKKIEDMRNVYNSQIRRKTEDSDFRNNQIEESYKAEMSKRDNIAKQQKSNLENMFKTELQEKDNTYNQFIDNFRKEGAENWSQRREQLNELHQKELGAVRQDRDEKLTTIQTEFDKMKTAKDYQIRDQARLAESNKQRMSESFLSKMKQEQEAYGNILDAKDIALTQSLKDMQDKYSKVVENKGAEFDAAHESLKEKVTDRVDNEVRGLALELRTEKDRRASEMFKNKVQTETEKKHIVSLYEDKLSDYERQKNEALQIAKDGKYKQVERVNRTKDKLLQETNRDYSERLDLQSVKNSEDRVQAETNHKNQLSHVTRQADKRVGQALTNAQGVQETLAQYYEEALDQAKAIQQENLNNLRADNVKERSEMSRRYETRFREIEGQFVNKQTELIKQQDMEIQQLKENQKKDLSRNEETFKTRTKQREKAWELEKANMVQKYESRLAALQESNEKNLDRMHQKHQEEIATLVQKSQFRKS